jgi:hypothetical protein
VAFAELNAEVFLGGQADVVTITVFCFAAYLKGASGRGYVYEFLQSRYSIVIAFNIVTSVEGKKAGCPSCLRHAMHGAM